MTQSDRDRIEQAAKAKFPVEMHDAGYGLQDINSISRTEYVDTATAEAAHWEPIVEKLKQEVTALSKIHEDFTLIVRDNVIDLADRDATITRQQKEIEELVEQLERINTQLGSDGTLDQENLTLTGIYEANEVLIGKHKKI